jgi:ribokinase
MLPNDIICIGNATIDVFLTIDENNPHVKLDSKTKELRFGHGEKIEIQKMDTAIGGNATNVSVGISRLGLKSALIAEIGKDEFSQKILNALNREKVNLEFVKQTENEGSSLTVGLNFKKDRTLFVEHVEREHNFEFKENQAKAIYLTSLGEDWEKAYKNTLNFAANNSLQIFFNPGTLQIEKRGALIWSAIAKSDFLFVNKEEAEELLYGKEINLAGDSKNYAKKLLFGLKSLGAKIVVITDGANGSFVMDEKHNVYFLDILKTEVIEKTGAGDAYNSGFIAAVLSDKDILQAMRYGTLNSASVIEKVGAQKGLLTQSEMINKLNDNSDFFPKQI